MRLHFRNGDLDHEIEVVPAGDHWQATVGGETRTVQAEPDGDGGLLLDWEGRRRRVRVAAVGDERFVFCEGRVHRLRIHDPDTADEEAAAGGPGLRADMPGKVVRVLVAEGDRVEVGQPALIMESMKMETELAVGASGTVAAVHVASGDVVAQDDPLLDIDPDGPADEPGEEA